MFDSIITDMESNEKVSSKATELFLRGRKFSISPVFISLSYFEIILVPKILRLNETHSFYHQNS